MPSTSLNPSPQPNPKVRSKAKIYILHSTYSSVEAAKKTIEDGILDSTWYNLKTTVTVKGQTIWFGCKMGSKARNQACPKMVKLVVNTSTDVCRISVSEDEHDHQNLEPKFNAISTETKSKIAEYERLNCKPLEILINIRQVGLQIPTTTQLNNYLKQLRKDKGLEGELGTRICLNDNQKIYDDHKQIPENPDQIIADCYTDASYDNGELCLSFRIFFTTVRLLSFTKYVSVPIVCVIFF